jgi:hypothetical protein
MVFHGTTPIFMRHDRDRGIANIHGGNFLFQGSKFKRREF